jgi:hypothetical protein
LPRLASNLNPALGSLTSSLFLLSHL